VVAAHHLGGDTEDTDDTRAKTGRKTPYLAQNGRDWRKPGSVLTAFGTVRNRSDGDMTAF
jgi:hypothetical protein